MEKDYRPTDPVDAIHYAAARRFAEKHGVEVVKVGNGLPDIEVKSDETIVGSNGTIYPYNQSKRTDVDEFEDPKYRGQGGRFPGFDH